jgi:DNA-binding FadR family transcriptional regulator
VVTSSGRGLHGDVVETLGQRIVRGEFAPGEVIEVGRLGDELSVSRTVLREALRVLRAKGLVDARPKRGTFVRPRSEWSVLDADVIAWHGSHSSKRLLADLNELRQIFEPSVARLAAARRGEDDLLEMKRAVESLAESVDRDRSEEGFVAADVAFHHALLAAAHNELLSQLAPVLEQTLRFRDQLVVRDLPPDNVAFLIAHRAVFEAVRSGDEDGAEHHMRTLLRSAAKDVEHALVSDRDL